MRIYRFDASAGRGIEQFGSLNLVMSPIQRGQGRFQLGCMHLGPGGLVGRHQAQGPQLFLVVQGHGWVSGNNSVRVPIAPGRAAFWLDGEWHEAGSDGGMDALVLEADALDPAQFLPEVSTG